MKDMKTLTCFILLLLYCLSVPAQAGPVVHNLVFEGAGIRGIAYCGAVAELENTGRMPGVKKVAGTSAGAIAALLVALGYSAEEMQAIIAGTNFRKFNDGRYFFPGGIHRTNKFFGWYRGLRVERWIEALIEKKTGDASISFSALYEKGFKELYITGTNVNKQQLVIFSRHHYPNMKVKDAIRISMSIPFYFEAVFIDKNGLVVRHPKDRQGLDVFIDGGLTGNFPIQVFDSSGTADPHTLGFRIDRDEQIQMDKGARTIAPMPVNSFKEYAGAFYNMIIENLNRQQLTNEDWRRTVSISDGKIGPRIRKLSAAEIKILTDNGRAATRKFLLN